MSPDSSAPPHTGEAARLCLDCGLCCNGVLFDQVRLQPGDHPKALTARGLKLKKGQWFNQPCTALCGSLCQLYHDRPTRCRQFACRQYRQVATGAITSETALRRIATVRHQVREVETQLAPCGGDNLRKPLAQRYATAAENHTDTVVSSGLAHAMQTLQAALDLWFRV